jgi:hypothetical protein
MLVDTSDPQFRESFRLLMQKKEDELARALRRVNTDMVSVLTSEPYEVPLKKFFKTRMRKR